MKTALIADDDINMCSILFQTLEENNFRCSIVRNGKELQLLLSGQPKYDIAIVDIVMPKYSGHEAVELAQVIGCNIPILYMSGLAVLEGDELEHFIEKPFDKKTLLEKINKTINEFKC